MRDRLRVELGAAKRHREHVRHHTRLVPLVEHLRGRIGKLRIVGPDRFAEHTTHPTPRLDRIVGHLDRHSHQALAHTPSIHPPAPAVIAAPGEQHHH